MKVVYFHYLLVSVSPRLPRRSPALRDVGGSPYLLELVFSSFRNPHSALRILRCPRVTYLRVHFSTKFHGNNVSVSLPAGRQGCLVPVDPNSTDSLHTSIKSSAKFQGHVRVTSEAYFRWNETASTKSDKSASSPF